MDSPAPPKRPLLNIFRFVGGDSLAKALAFLAAVWLAGTLGVRSFGVLEFALAILTWTLILADGGIEAWAVRELARGADLETLAGRVLPLRVLLATGAFGLLVLVLPLLPDYPVLRTMMLLFGGSLLASSLSLKWAYMGREKMAQAGTGLVLAQIVFLGGALAFVRDPADLVIVPLVRVAADATTTIWFAFLWARERGGFRIPLRLRGAKAVLLPATGLCAASALGIASFNFDTLLLGFLRPAEDVGLYGAAYKPIVAGLAIPLAYFIGLYPTLARTFATGPEPFRAAVAASFRFAAAFAVSVAVFGFFLAEDGLRVLFGEDYVAGAPALRILAGSAMLVILRGTFRQGLLATGNVRLDLRCAGAATGLNIVLNFVLIPRFGVVGAASATLSSEVLWLATATTLFRRRVARVPLLPGILLPLAAGAATSGAFLLTGGSSWPIRAVAAAAVYTGVLIAGETVRRRRRRKA